MKNKTIGLAMIVKDEEKVLDRALASIAPYVDSIYITDTGSTDGTLDIAKKYKANISNFKMEFVTVPISTLPVDLADVFEAEGISELKFISNFAEARNFNFSQVKEDYIIWMDADDIIRGGEHLKELIQRDFDALECIYNYDINAEGQVLIKQPKQRIIKNDKSWFWSSELHEHLDNKRQVRIYSTNDMVWDHRPDKVRAKIAPWRNLAVVQHKIGDKPLTECDPRDVYSLANCYMGCDDFSKAVEVFGIYIPMSNWDEEIYQALLRTAVCYSKLGKHGEMIQPLLKAIEINPIYPDAYSHMGSAYFHLQQYVKAEHYLRLALTQPVPQREQVMHPMDYEWNPLYLLGVTEAQLGNLDGAIKAFQQLEKLTPNHTGVKETMSQLRVYKDYELTVKAIQKLYGAIKEHGTEEQARYFFKSLPGEYQLEPGVYMLRNEVAPKTTSSGKELAIYCGHPWEPWDSSSIESGIGGSEEAVIQIAERLAKLGWEVTVYGYPVNEGIQNGVNYRFFWECNFKDKMDVFISWRNPTLFDGEINATQKYLWLHDVPQVAEFIPSRVEKIDKIFVLSKFHRSFLKDIPEDKFFYTANGIDAKDFEIKVERNPKKLIYTSAPDRGLECLLELWPRIKAEVPDAELVTYYGWNSWDKGNATDLKAQAWKAQLIKKLESAGLDYRRIGHQEIAKEMLSSGVWVYPTQFPEISCITAMKAQLAGAIPVTVDYSALNETVQYGFKIEADDIYTNKEAQDKFVKTVVEQMKNPISRETMMEWAKYNYSWDRVSESWNELFTTL